MSQPISVQNKPANLTTVRLHQKYFKAVSLSQIYMLFLTFPRAFSKSSCKVPEKMKSVRKTPVTASYNPSISSTGKPVMSAISANG